MVDGKDHVLTVPVPGGGSGPVGCANEAFRVGASAGIGDCRAYEQVTPVDKEGAEEPFRLLESGAVAGETGDTAMLSAPFTKWGSSQGPYFFSRGEAGWSMVSTQVQPEAGIDQYGDELLSGDLSRLAFTAQWSTSTEAKSPNIELKSGVPGGPYPLAASVPRTQFGEEAQSGWVAASADFSNLVMQVEDHALVGGHPSSTKAGSDLYEYAAGGVRQLNVLPDGETVGGCGATMAIGHGEQLAG